MLIELVVTIVTFIFMSLLGLMVLFRNSKSWTNRFFLLLTLTIDLYLVTNYISLHPPDPLPSTQLFWIRVVMAQGSFLGPALFLLVHTFPKDKFQLKPHFLIGILGLAFTSAILSLSPFLFTSIEYPQGKPTPIPGPAIPIFAVDFAGLFLLSFILLIIKFKRAKGIERIQNLYFLSGVIGTFTLMVVSTVFFVVFFKLSDFVFLGPVSSLILIVAVAYTIVKHRFLDIRLIVARAVAYLFFILLIGGFYSVTLFFLGSILLDLPFSLNQVIFYGFTTLLAVFSLNPVKRVTEKLTRSIFYRGYYSSQDLIKLISQITSTIIKLDDLTDNALKTLLSEIKITKGAFVLYNKDKSIGFIKSSGFEQEDIFSRSNMDMFFGKRKIIIFDETEEGELKDPMRKLGVSVTIPLISSDVEIGTLLLGEKASGEIYTKQDIDVIEILAPHLSVAVHNSMEYEEIKTFNITLKMEIEKATSDLKAANEKLKELDRLKDEFVSLASHELRTPMTVIKSYIWSLLNTKMGDLNEKQKTYLDRTYTTTERLINLVNDMLNVSRIESGRLTIEPSPTDLGKIIDEVVEEMQEKAHELEIEIVYSRPETLMVMADQGRIKEVLINLIGNSLKFTPSGGLITVTNEKDMQGFILTRIKDTGKGIGKDDITNLFQKFNTIGRNLTRDKSQGTGLGLYLSKSLVELHGGKIWAESEGEGKGSTFLFTLPILKFRAEHQTDTYLPPESNLRA